MLVSKVTQCPGQPSLSPRLRHPLPNPENRTSGKARPRALRWAAPHPPPRPLAGPWPRCGGFRACRGMLLGAARVRPGTGTGNKIKGRETNHPCYLDNLTGSQGWMLADCWGLTRGPPPPRELHLFLGQCCQLWGALPEVLSGSPSGRFYLDSRDLGPRGLAVLTHVCGPSFRGGWVLEGAEPGSRGPALWRAWAGEDVAGGVMDAGGYGGGRSGSGWWAPAASPAPSGSLDLVSMVMGTQR